MTRKLLRGLFAATLMCALAPFAHAQSEDDLLPVEQAFKLTAKISEPGRIALHWDIAPDYYLYRTRIKAKTIQAGATLADLDLPAGTKKHDEFIAGDVEVYHHRLDATLPYTIADATTKTLAVTITVQGCHEVDPKICYPPHPTLLTLDVPAAAGSAIVQDTNTADATVTAARPGLNLGGGQPLTANAGEPLPPEQAFVFEAIAASPTGILARWTMPKGYYLYRDKSSVSLADGAGVTLGAPQWPKGIDHTDEHFGTVVVYFDQVELPIPLTREAGAVQTIKLNAEYQGCQDNGICYPVMTKVVSVEMPVATGAELAAAKATFVPTVNQEPPSPGLRPTSPASGRGEIAASASAGGRGDGIADGGGQSEEQALAANLSSNRWLALLSFFGFGLLLAFTPCVFPMIPILSGIIAGSGENVTTRRAFVLSVVYVLATCVVFTIAGVVAGLAGANLQAAFQKPWILWSFAILFVLLSLSMFGFYELQLPSAWQTKIADISNKQKGGSLIGVAIMGLLSALIVGPCVAPPLAAAVLYISQTRDPVFGGLALFVLSLGMGAPLVVFGTAAGKLLPRAGGWMDAVKAVFGVMFLGLSIWMLARILDGFWIMLMTGVLLIASAVYLGALERLAEGASGWRRLWKALGIVLLVAGAAEILGAAAGGRDVTQPLAGIVASGGSGNESHRDALAFRTIKSVADLDRELAAAKEAHQPVMLDFYADWCVSCKEMEKFTFSRPDVQQALSGFVLLKADVTANDDDDQALLKHFALFGPPATIFFNDGDERRALRLIGFEKAEDFIVRTGKLRG